MGLLLLTFNGIAQTTNVTYTPSTVVFSNPDRGFYKFTSTNSSSAYNALNQSTLSAYKSVNNISLIYREFRLEAFINTPISADFLTNMQNDFDKIRNAGLKCIIRFTYSNSETVAQRDASKAIILAHLVQLKPLLQANSDVISIMQAGFIGSWGEWYYTSQAEFGGGGYDGTALTATNISNRRDVVNAMLDALPSNRMIQLRTPAFKRALFSTTALLDSQAYNQSSIARIGHYNDCFLASSDDYGTYVNTSIEYPYLAQETKYLPMGGETCALDSPRSDCSSALAEMTQFHWSFLNSDYNPDVLSGFQSGNCYTDIQKKLGYRFQLTSASFPQAVAVGSTLNLNIKLLNLGFAAPFNEIHSYLILKNTVTNKVFSVLMNANPRLWLGTNEISINESLALPNSITAGNYQLYLSLPDNSTSLANRSDYAIRFANENVWDAVSGFNNLNYTLNVSNSFLANVDNSKLNLTIYPVPANDEIIVQMDGIEKYSVAMFNSIGQNVKVQLVSETNKITIPSQNLSSGLYFIAFTNGTFKDVRKVIIKH